MVLRDVSWRRQAKCLDADPEIFFPRKGDNFEPAAAKRICAACPVTSQCLAYHNEMLESSEVHADIGVWGGTHEGQRRRLRRVERQTCSCGCGRTVGEGRKEANTCRARRYEEAKAS